MGPITEIWLCSDPLCTNEATHTFLGEQKRVPICSAHHRKILAAVTRVRLSPAKLDIQPIAAARRSL